MSREEQVDPFSRSALRYHVPWLLGVGLCAFAGWFELTRAQDGHAIAWVYTVEWPLFGVVGTLMWWRIITNRDLDESSGRPSPPMEPAPDAPPDPGLVAWQEYLDTVQRDDLGSSGPTATS